MNNQAFKLEAVAPMAWDFGFSIPDQQKTHNPTEEPPVAHNVALQAGSRVVDITKPFVPPRYRSMPPEIQALIWAEKMQKPGLHFLAVHVPLKEKPQNNNKAGVRKIKLTEICHKVHKVHSPYRSYFPEGMRSAYHRWSDLSTAFPFARAAMKQALIDPLTVCTHNGFDVTIDAATDLLYLKFHWKPTKRGHSQYLQSPAYWMLILDHSDLKGVRHVALEVNNVDECIFWPQDENDACGFCGWDKDDHNDDVSSELWLLADFLHCFHDLESVYLVFNDISQGPVDPRRDPRYTISGRPDVHAIETEPSRWDSSSDPVFRGDGGYVRELRGNHVILPVAHVAETLHAYYVFHHKTAIDATEAVSQRTREERHKVLFKLATCGKDE